MNKISVTDIEAIVGFKISQTLKLMMLDLDLAYESISPRERDEIVVKILNKLEEDLVPAGEHRLEQWERGWYENFELLKAGQNANSLVPKYFGKQDIARWNGNFVRGHSIYFDYYQLIIMIDAILHEYVGDNYSHLVEIGCGPAYHLLRFSNFNDRTNLVGLDWTTSSQDIIKKIGALGINNKIIGGKFDFFNPDYNLFLAPNSAVFTCNALEQIGDRYKPFVDWILDKKPGIVINFEPMTELLNQDELVDKLSIMYSEKRKYLKGYLSYLRELERDGKIEIILIKRFGSGSLYLEGYPVVIWKVK